MEPEAEIGVEIAYALPAEQVVVALRVPRGATVKDVLRLSGLPARFTDLDAASATFGIYGKQVSPDTVVADGDRVEIYRPLLADPKQVRRSRAQRP